MSLGSRITLWKDTGTWESKRMNFFLIGFPEKYKNLLSYFEADKRLYNEIINYLYDN